MHMKKIGVFSGFLGSGKTTTLMALTQYCRGQGTAAAMISNDLGGKGLADDRYARLRGCSASELTGDCICYQTENLVERLDSLFDDGGCELVISDIPGFGVGALEHVYHTLNERYHGRYALAPFTVLAEPATVTLLREGGSDLAYILHTQLVEADLIVLNKCDLPDAPEREEALKLLRSRYPQARVLPISAHTGEGIPELAEALLQGEASLRRPDIGYGGADFSAAMGKLCEYNLQYYATVCCDSFDGDAYLLALAEAARAVIRELGGEIPHLKLLAWEPEGSYGRVDLLGAEKESEVNQSIGHPCTELAVVLNSSAVCAGKALDGPLTAAVERVSEEYNLTLSVYHRECFDLIN